MERKAVMTEKETLHGEPHGKNAVGTRFRIRGYRLAATTPALW